MVKHLVNERDEVNVADAYRCTPLHYSSMLNALDSTTSNCDSTKNASMAIMRTLLKNGANVNTRNECGDTPFHTSVKTNNPIAVDNLLYNEYVNGEKACKLRDIDNQNQKGNTPLHLAIKVENQDIIKLLLVKGANVNTMNHKRETPFGIAIRKGNKDIINKLEPYFNINYRYPIYQMTYLHYAVETKNSDFVFYLLERGADANARDKGNWTPLHYSVKEWNTGITQMLLNKGADVFAEDNDSKTPLHYALENKNLELFRLLSQQNSNRLYPLHFAVISQNVNLIKQLVNKGQPNLFFGNDNTTCYSKGVDINITDNNGRTPLHFAVNCCQDSLIFFSAMTTPLVTPKE
ncbi:Ankyrin repeats (3 copies) [Popillia japonica]|uniref:Ankyrin repeats (3 copies) n=1 Tax=Popillia japonica TaxID=7064 RepID=A0AAW1IX26_POPJA